jgi:hypothetical protein
MVPKDIPSSLSLVKYLVYFSTQAVNMIFTTNSNLTTPLEKFIGRKLDFKVNLRVAFGDYCQVSSADIDNSLSPQTSGAIALLPSHNLRGSVTFYDLTTMRVMKTDTFKILPISHHISKSAKDTTRHRLLLMRKMSFQKSNKLLFSPNE